MNREELIDELISELCLLHSDGLPHLNSSESLSYISEFFKKRGMIGEGNTVIQNLLEDDKGFSNPALNKVIQYKSVNGEDAEGKVGNLLRRPKEEDAYKKAVSTLGGKDSDSYKKAMDDLGGEGQPQRDIEGEREAGDEGEPKGEEPQTATAFDPNTKGGEAYLKGLPDTDPAKPDSMKDDSEETLSAGGVVYPVGGGYYADTPDGEPKYRKATEEGVDKMDFRYILEEEDVVGKQVVKTVADTDGGSETMVVMGDKEKAKAAQSVDTRKETEREKQTQKGNKTNKTLSKQQQKDLDDMKSKSENWNDELNDSQKKLLDESFYHIEIILSDDGTDEEKRESAEWLQQNVGFATNADKSKAYLNKFGGLRKILSNMAGAGSSATKRLVSEIEKHATLKEFNAGGVKKKLTAAAKPDLGKENEFSPKKHPNVDSFFRNHPQLSKVREGLWGLFGVKDENGSMKMPSNQYASEYLEQSFNNPALTRTIEAAKEFAKNGDLDPKFVSALEKHKDRISKITQEYEIPSEEAATAIENSYNQMMTELHEADSDSASAVLKQLAENFLYEVELARGEEVYLPSNGSFPGGDKIKVDKLERVSLISCKWGKSGRTYGCPANAKAVTSLHPNESKRENQGQYVGEDGYNLLVNDNLIKGETTQETKEKTSKFMKDTLREIGLDGTFTDEEYEEISKITTEYLEFIESVKEELKDVTPAEKYWQLFNKKIQDFENEISERLAKIVTEDKVAQLIGENNKSALGPKGKVRPQNLLSAIEISNNIRTSNGYGLEHNKQYFDKTGKPKFQTDMGTANPDDYSITFRDKRTPGRTGGGCQLSFTGDAKVDVNLGEDGIQTDLDGKSIFD